MSKESSYYQLKSVSGNHDSKELKRELDTFPGVISVSVNKEKNTLAVDYDNTGVNPEKLTKCIEKLGYQIERHKIEEHKM